MRVGLDGIPLCEIKTGVGHYTFELARSLASIASEDDFELVSPSPYLTTNSTEPKRTLPSNLRLVHAKVNRLGRRFWSSVGLPLYLHKASLTLFHGTNYDIPLWNRCPTILTIHDLSLLLHPETHEEHLVRRAAWKLPLMARTATAIITPSAAVRSEVRDLLHIKADKIVAISEAQRSSFHRVPLLETKPIRQRLGIEDEFILFVGTIEPRKNLLNLLRAFDEILRTTSLRPQLVIAGKKGWLSNDLFSFWSSAEIKSRVLFTGYLSDNELRALYSSCLTFVYPSLYEGFGLPLLEAMACGAPVITSRTSSIMETVGDVARLISPTDFHDLADAIIHMLQDSKERERRSTAGIQHALRFSWEKTAKATLDLYREVVKKQKRYRGMGYSEGNERIL
jgi:glycosyltransferase involved in cell wall biosynthesis